MAHLFAGAPDARQTDAAVIAPSHSLFRKRYRQLTDAEVALQDAIKDKVDELAGLIGCLNPSVAAKLGVTIASFDSIPDSIRDAANITLAIRHIEDAVYRAVKALTA